MVIDVVSFNGEFDLFDLRYSILSPYVDEFIVVEFDKTFSGKSKPYYFELIKDKYEKIRFCPMDTSKYEKYYEEAIKSPNTQYGKGAKNWLNEWAQKESIKDCLTHLKDDDIVFVGDVDEIVEPKEINGFKGRIEPLKLRLGVYTYWLNNRSSEEFWGTLVTPYKIIKDSCLNHLRTNAKKTIFEYGWHFTSMAGDLRRKLTDSYTAESYATPQVLDNLETNIKENRDFLGRPFTYTIDESDWPQYLKDNREKYEHLCK